MRARRGTFCVAAARRRTLLRVLVFRQLCALVSSSRRGAAPFCLCPPPPPMSSLQCQSQSSICVIQDIYTTTERRKRDVNGRFVFVVAGGVCGLILPQGSGVKTVCCCWPPAQRGPETSLALSDTGGAKLWQWGLSYLQEPRGSGGEDRRMLKHKTHTHKKGVATRRGQGVCAHTARRSARQRGSAVARGARRPQTRRCCTRATANSCQGRLRALAHAHWDSRNLLSSLAAAAA